MLNEEKNTKKPKSCKRISKKNKERLRQEKTSLWVSFLVLILDTVALI